MLPTRILSVLSLAALLALAPAIPAAAQHILFVRGAERSGGFLEAGSDTSRTEHLAGLDNDSNFRGNHGWKTLADTLTEAGYKLTEMAEILEDTSTKGQSEGRPLPFEKMDLSQYDAIIFGSNNARYGKDAVDAIEAYLRAGGAAMFISDANFGGSWADASDSDQPFVQRLGLTMNQDNGTYVLRREDNEFVAPDHPILAGVNAFDGEGVTPVTVNETLPEGVRVTILARAKGRIHTNQEPRGERERGPARNAAENDAVLLAATIDQGRVVCHFDRNTFFNKGGAGTDITRFDNRRLALNLFAWLTGNTQDQEPKE